MRRLSTCSPHHFPQTSLFYYEVHSESFESLLHPFYPSHGIHSCRVSWSRYVSHNGRNVRSVAAHYRYLSSTWNSGRSAATGLRTDLRGWTGRRRQGKLAAKPAVASAAVVQLPQDLAGPGPRQAKVRTLRPIQADDELASTRRLKEKTSPASALSVDTLLCSDPAKPFRIAMADKAKERIEALGKQLGLPPIQRKAGPSNGLRLEGKVAIITGRHWLADVPIRPTAITNASLQAPTRRWALVVPPLTSTPRAAPGPSTFATLTALTWRTTRSKSALPIPLWIFMSASSMLVTRTRSRPSSTMRWPSTSAWTSFSPTQASSASMACFPTMRKRISWKL